MTVSKPPICTTIDAKTVEGFDQDDLPADEQLRLFEAYFSTFPWNSLPPAAEGFDLGCGSGRWAVLVAPRVGKLHCIDPAAKALGILLHIPDTAKALKDAIVGGSRPAGPSNRKAVDFIV